MKDLTVSELAAISGVTVRTLHHYDEIGLLKPATIGANGYRYYGRAQLLRLQRILFHRELGVPLQAVAELLELEGTDALAVLREHRHELASRRERLSVLIETVDRTIADLKGEQSMSNADLYQGFSAEKQAGYEQWLEARYGDGAREAIAHSRAAWQGREGGMQSAMEDLRQIEEALAEACRREIDPESAAVEGPLARHRDWVATMWGRDCQPEAYAGLADLYLAHPDFVARYERLAAGFTAYLAGAMKAHAARHGDAPIQTT